MAQRIAPRVAGLLPGGALALAALVAGAARRNKALHPVGRHGVGQVLVTRADAALAGSPLGEEGTRPCELRWSRAMGLPRSWPDIEGLALRLPGGGADGGAGDLLFASTGARAWSRHLLTLRRPGEHGVLTTLLPVRAAGGAVVFRLTPTSLGATDLPAAYSLDVAPATGAWRPIGEVEVAWSLDDTTVRFDPVARQLAGTEQYDFVTALREPAYVAARTAARAKHS